MKFYYQRPTKEIRIVKPDSGTTEYEFWILTPVRVGSARKVGTQQIIAEDGQRFANLNSAALYFTNQHDQRAGTPASSDSASPPAQVTVPGMHIVIQGKWAEFCRARNINPTTPEHISKTYSLTPDELAQLGLSHEEMQ